LLLELFFILHSTTRYLCVLKDKRHPWVIKMYSNSIHEEKAEEKEEKEELKEELRKKKKRN
jgi:hypothetical protein